MQGLNMISVAKLEGCRYTTTMKIPNPTEFLHHIGSRSGHGRRTYRTPSHKGPRGPSITPVFLDYESNERNNPLQGTRAKVGNARIVLSREPMRFEIGGHPPIRWLKVMPVFVVCRRLGCSVGGRVCSEILLITLAVVAVIVVFFGTYKGRDG